MGWLIFIGIISIIYFVGWIAEIYRKIKEYDRLKPSFDNLEKEKRIFEGKIKEYDRLKPSFDNLEKEKGIFEGKINAFNIVREKWEQEKITDIENIKKYKEETSEDIKSL